MTTFDGDTPSGETVDVIETTDADEAAAPEAEVSLEAEEAAPTSDEVEQATPTPLKPQRLTRPTRPSVRPRQKQTAKPKKRTRPSRSRRTCASSPASGT